MSTARSVLALLSVLAVAGAGPVRAQSGWQFGRIVPAPGVQTDEPSYHVAVSADGQTVAFASEATNWYPGNEPQTKIMVLDLVRGVLENAARTGGGTPIGGIAPALSADGRYVVFANYGSPLDVGVPTSGWQILRKDRHTGQLRLASANAAGQAAQGSAPGQARDASVSANGRWVAFRSDAGNLAGPSGGEYNIFVKDLDSGAIEAVSTTTGGALTAFNDIVPGNALSGDGRFVVFSSPAGNLVAGVPAPGLARVYLRDRATGLTEVVSRNTAGDMANNQSDNAAISRSGRYVAFRSFASNLGSAQVRHIHLRDRRAGTTTPVPIPSGYDSCNGAVVSDVPTVLMHCNGSAGQQVFLHVPGVPGNPLLVSADALGQPGNGLSGGTLAVDASGLSMAFESLAGSLDPSDTNGYSDIFVLVADAVLERVFTDGFGD